MKKPLVSVVMGCYNHAAYVGKTIESVLNQTYTNFELIIVDDASQDNSVEVIKQYTDSRIRFEALEVNTGFGAPERAFNMARGEYIAVLGSDDMWKNNLLECYVDFLENHEGYVCCFSVPEVIDENDVVIENSGFEKIFEQENRTKEEWFKRLYMYGNCFCAPGACMRYSVFEKLGPMRYQYRQLQDYEYWLRTVQLGNVYIYPKSLMYYRKHYTDNTVNISAPTTEVNTRDLMERKFMMWDIMENIDADYFYEVFKDSFVLQPSNEGFCLECEKFVVMLKSSYATVHAAIFYYFNHYQDEVFKYYLENYYHISRKEIWKITGVEVDRGVAALVEQAREQELMRQIVELRKKVQEQEDELKSLRGISE